MLKYAKSMLKYVKVCYGMLKYATVCYPTQAPAGVQWRHEACHTEGEVSVAASARYKVPRLHEARHSCSNCFETMLSEGSMGTHGCGVIRRSSSVTYSTAIKFSS